MKIVLSERDLDDKILPSDISVIKITRKNIYNYNDNDEVIAIIGTRAMAIKVSKMVFEKLKLFQLTSAGYEGVPIDLFRKQGVVVANAGDVYNAPIAETVIMGMLLMAKRLHKNPNNRHIKIFRHYDKTITELKGKKILILGTGNIGTAVASRLRGFEVIIDGYNRTAAPKPQYSKVMCGYDELKKCICEYDYIISTLPYTAQTRGLIDGDVINNMSDNAILINVGRREVFNEDELYEALKRRKIKGAVLDMYEKLPNPFTNRFKRLSNAIVMPGVSAISEEVNLRLKEHMTQNVLAIIYGNSIVSSISGG